MAKIKWNLDPSHSEIIFKVKHLMISTVTGQFRRFDVSAESESGDFTSPSRIKFTADVSSIDTNNQQRDNHLRSADFFDAANFPEISFIGQTNHLAGDTSRLTGDLTIKGITRRIEFEVEAGGVVVDPYGQRKAGFTISGKINRKDFGLTWNAVTEAGSVVVGEDIKFHGEIQLVQQIAVPA